MKRPPIMIRCEGSGAQSTYCQMCAIPAMDGVVPEHHRQHVLAMLARGDFDHASAPDEANEVET